MGGEIGGERATTLLTARPATMRPQGGGKVAGAASVTGGGGITIICVGVKFAAAFLDT